MTRILKSCICSLALCAALAALPLSALAAPLQSDVMLSAKNGSYQTGQTLSFSAACSYDGAPNTPGSLEYRPVTWTVTNTNIGTCQYAAAAQGLALDASGNFTLLVTYNAYAYDSVAGSYSLLQGSHTVSVPFTVTDSVIPNTIDVTELGISLAIMLIGIVGAILCLSYLKKRVYPAAH
ncbi:MAG: hypothetical protein Q4C13_05495 [Clostridia bacterium]|nr:hypothetical protein [Clostridia bacterium]